MGEVRKNYISVYNSSGAYLQLSPVVVGQSANVFELSRSTIGLYPHARTTLIVTFWPRRAGRLSAVIDMGRYCNNVLVTGESTSQQLPLIEP